MISKIVLPHSFECDYTCDYLVGADYGAYLLASKKIMMDLAIGDFDSVNEEEFNEIKKYSKDVVKLNVDKNETDSEAALMYVSLLNKYDIKMIMDLGNRFDHLLNNFRLLSKYSFSIHSEFNDIFLYDIGFYTIKNTHDYLSLFAIDKTKVSLKGTLYPLDSVAFNEQDTYLTSNRILGDEASLTVEEGRVVVVLSKDV